MANTPRIIFKPFRVADLNDAKVAQVQPGESFIVENAGATEHWYKRSSDGALVKISGGSSGGGNYTLPVASGAVLGGVKAGSGVAIAADGTLSVTGGGNYTLPVASGAVLGGVKAGSGVTIAADGTISAAAGGGSGNLYMYEFNVTFAGSNPSQVTNLPAGWTAAISGTDVTITHTCGKVLKTIQYWGVSTIGGLERMRLPSSSNEVTIESANRITKFTARITTAVTGADADGTARIVVTF
jgi:hypothetical protein